ncbi:prolyl oligopeptidase family serine peptidase [Shewanella avicenniae]|uniref:Prolyl oligopeptidase family serine peptidase n=1 Tax=Shewanella avicenniae TaxID=2814294 RepID=A0ABX7QSF8_9GAMM|nr:prolyl oligopeptidase family serine peptidase [Shewanella avicenniae]QSX34344.1 prolyl oligopeptidase family serine peptidase [Shewanella avicenniae]
MNNYLRQLGLSAIALAVLSGCAATSAEQTLTAAVTVVAAPTLATPPVADQPLTLNQIMADPDWMGLTAEGAYWSDNGESVLFSRGKSASRLRDYYRLNIASGETEALPLAELHKASQRLGVYSADKKRKAYVYQNNLFVKDIASGNIQQLTRQADRIDGASFLNNGDVVYWQGDKVFQIDSASGMVAVLADIRFSKAPEGVKDPSSFLAKQQARLIQYVAQEHAKAKAAEDYKAVLRAADPTMAAEPFYLGEQDALQELSVSPDGQYLFLVLQDKNYTGRAQSDIMPNYIHADGEIESVPVRARVAEDDVPGQRFVVLDLAKHSQKDVTIEGLTGYNEDVLAKVKAENAKAEGKQYQSETKPRKIRLIEDWSWVQSALQWQDGKPVLAVMVEAVDNKDRWIATVDLQKGKFVTQHRLHDDAWINYDHNQFGWLPNSDTLFYLSEQSGYAQLYIKPLAGKEKALTSGNYVVSDVTVGPKAQYIYYKANKDHPGKYNVYRVELATGKNEQLTDWTGTLDYQLNPSGDSLLLTASQLTKPDELYLQPIGGELKQLTNYTSAEFANYPWQAPEIIEVPSTHGAGKVYARLYLPKGFDKRRAEKYPAVIFNHGAGYLQEVHYGFSGYFREFMFNNLLAQQGYVVLDMDYRGSKGYGRDWRTAIYRNMGHPEVEDLKDGVAWMVQNTNIDPTRVGTYGGSYGGFLTFMSMFREPELFKAGAALRPVADWAHYNTGYTSNILNTPDDDAIAYNRSSPIEFAAGLKNHLLILGGVVDNNVFFQDSVRLVQHLIELENPNFDMAYYPVEPHGFRQPSSWLDEYRRIFRLFETDVKPLKK